MLRITRKEGERVLIYDSNRPDRPLVISAFVNDEGGQDEVVLEFEPNQRFVVLREEMLHKPTFNLNEFIQQRKTKRYE